MTQTNDSATFRIWIAGCERQARQTIRAFCNAHGDCYSVSDTEFIYTGGAEAGVCVTRINYPRFPLSPDEILARVRSLAQALARDLHQRSYSIEGPEFTEWVEVDLGTSI